MWRGFALLKQFPARNLKLKIEWWRSRTFKLDSKWD